MFGAIAGAIGGAIGSLFSSGGGSSILGGALGSIISNVGSSYLSNLFVSSPNAATANEVASDAAKEQWERTYWAYKRRYQDTVADMQAAGLNPILAVSNGFNVGSGPQATRAEVFKADTPSGVNDFAGSAKAFSEVEKVEAEKEKIQEEAKYLKAKANEAIQNALKIREEKKLVTQEEKNAVRTMFNLEKEFEVKNAGLQKTFQEIQELMSRTEMQEANQDLMVAKKREAEAESRRLQYLGTQIQLQLAQLQKLSNIYKGPAGQVMAYVKEIMNSLNLNLGLIGGMRR